ncbi:MAG TPA: hypothetical protein VLN59_04630 [Burkholderiales bacterium]|nr:hypothetical protein [Burkholderiales bacterium]
MKKNSPHSYSALVPFFARNDPHSLLNLFTLLSFGSVVLILILAGYGGYRVYSREFIKGAEEDAVAVGRAIFVRERESLVTRDAAGTERIAVAPGAFSKLDARMREFLHPLHTSKIKVFSSDKKVVYTPIRRSSAKWTRVTGSSIAC